MSADKWAAAVKVNGMGGQGQEGRKQQQRRSNDSSQIN